MPYPYTPTLLSSITALTTWLEHGCDVSNAIAELKLIADRIRNDSQLSADQPSVAPSIHEQNAKAYKAALDEVREMLGLAEGESLKAAVQSLMARAAAAPSAEQAEPVAWYVMNGVQLYQLCCTENQANALSNQLQKQHDLSGSLASFHVKPLYTHAQPAQPAREPMTVAQRSSIRLACEMMDAYIECIKASGEYDRWHYIPQVEVTRDDLRGITAEVKRLQAEIGRLTSAASVSDAVAIVRERYRGTKWGKAAECICDAVGEAIIVQRPTQTGVQDAVVRDAERYRWLRKSLPAGQGSLTVLLDDRCNGAFHKAVFMESLDAAIDAAMTASRSQEGKA